MGGLATPMIIIVIFLVVWIVSNVIRAQQDAAQAAARRNAGNRQQPGTPRAENRGGNSDIDRFLQEIDRLRKKGQQEKQQQQQQQTQQQQDERAAPPPPPPRPRPVAERRTEPPRNRSGAPRPTREPRPAPPAPPPQSSSQRQQAPLVPELIESPAPPQTAKPGSLASSIDAKAGTARVAAEAAAKVAPGATTRRGAPERPRTAHSTVPLSATLQLIQRLFQSKQGAAAAVVLHEILGPPRAKRT